MDASRLQSCLTLCNPKDCSPPGSCPWDSPGTNAGVGCHALLQGILPTQGLNLCLLCFLPVGSLPLVPPEKPSFRNKHQQKVDNSRKPQMMVSIFFFFFWSCLLACRDQTCSPELEDRVLTTGSPGKSLMVRTF